LLACALVIPNSDMLVQIKFKSDSQVVVYPAPESTLLEYELSCLSKGEIVSANLLGDQIEYRHFVLRRAFQRQYVKMITGFPGPLADLELLHRRDKPPIYPPKPKLCLSFSSSANLYAAASSLTAKIGIDLEKHRSIANPLEIASRFFHASEVDYLRLLNFEEQQTEFLKFWTIKEACLKAIGRGVVYGLDTFLIRAFEHNYRVEPPPEFGDTKDWRIEIEPLAEDHWLTVAEFTQIRVENAN
jgi:4'-phosphopantetheinyl transferase